ncbi:aminoglycoside adenylyltransferase domain-containing protein [Paenibacillus glacialis]|uniref:Spectinomycin 9-adenylyltransferase n=1 Tax=Paenibacillus glacialis TaxID=494026 RepID=A0A168LQV5_9BACL|nr:aminoglycoside adenylyltransferase domain-containing protein [Paenibacillus glacialis]OAB43725.1 hypothetical protein PGLA_08050 [Paenibacillus glacialis]
MNTQVYLDKFVTSFKEELKENLLGIYLHGSLAMGCFNPKRSDIDFLVIVREKLTPVNNNRIANIALSLHDEMPNDRGIEFSIILETYLISFVYPTPFEFHYSDYHRDKYRADENYLCGGFEDEDLASQIVVAYQRGITLYGKPLSEICEPIDKQFYLASILNDVEGASRDIKINPPAYLTPMYLTLNLCRVLYFIKEGIVSSKREGGEWGAKELPLKYQGLVNECLIEYNGDIDKSELDPHQLLDFVDFMIGEIKQEKSLTNG